MAAYVGSSVFIRAGSSVALAIAHAVALESCQYLYICTDVQIAPHSRQTYQKYSAQRPFIITRDLDLGEVDQRTECKN